MLINRGMARRQDLAGFHGTIRTADAATGDILRNIDEHRLRDNTLLISTTDHGDAFPRAKATLYDPGLQVVFMVRPPDPWAVRPRTHHGMVSHVDLVPTLLELSGVEIPTRVQGESFAGLFRLALACPATTAPRTSPRRPITANTTQCRRSAPGGSNTSANYQPGPALRLPIDIEDSLSRSALGEAHLAPRAAEELYDLAHDPHERINSPTGRRGGACETGRPHHLAAGNTRPTTILHGPIPAPALAAGLRKARPDLSTQPTGP